MIHAHAAMPEVKFFQKVGIDLEEVELCRIRQAHEFHETHQKKEVVEMSELLSKLPLITGQRQPEDKVPDVLPNVVPLHVAMIAQSLEIDGSFIARCARISTVVSKKEVEHVADQIETLTDDQLASEFEKFFASQPAICTFVTELTSDSSSVVQELALYLSFVALRAVNHTRGEELPAVSPEAVERAHEAAEQWIDTMTEQMEGQQEEELIRSVVRSDEPHLLEFVLGELNHQGEDGESLEDEDKGEVFFLLKTVISCLSEKTS